MREQQCRQQIASLPLPQPEHFGVRRRAFGAAVPAAVVRLAIAVLFAVGRVALVVVADQVVQREAIMGGDEVDAGIGSAATVLVQIAGAGETVGELPHHAALTAPVIAHDVPVLAIPLGPADRKVAHLIATVPEVPGLGNQLHLRQDRVLVNDVHEGAELIHFVQFPGQRGCQIEAKTIDVHLDDPIPQAVHDQLQYPRMHHVQGIAAAGVVHVVAGSARHQAIIGGIVDTAKTQRRPQMVAFGGVVVDHIHDDFDTGGVQSLDQMLEFVETTAGGIAWIGGKVADGIVAPVVLQPPFQQMAVVDKGL
ncbi:MAG: hypothetical protein AW07_01624 [Candidatus Accumulibacter sp. SK-11]|nr:MAG: hypothetical protein AW07_01624 [Candidatus Accumulibacter sp. SK-11]